MYEYVSPEKWRLAPNGDLTERTNQRYNFYTDHPRPDHLQLANAVTTIARITNQARSLQLEFRNTLRPLFSKYGILRQMMWFV